MSGLLGVRFSGPLESYAHGFADELGRQGYKITGAKGQLFLVAHLSRWLAGRRLELSVLATPELVEEFFADRRAAGYTNYRTFKALSPLLTYLRELDVVGLPPVVELTPAQVMLERYRRYLTGERGLAATTARGYIDAVREFVTGRQVNGELHLEHLTAAEVTAFIVETCAGQTRGSAKMTVTALRSLLGFLHVDGILGTSLVAAVPSAASWRLAGLPKGLAPGEVSRLLAACDRRTRTGRRDFAVLMLLCRLGLRAGEVAALEIDDIDWRAGELVVRGKGKRHERLPLPDDVGRALVGYLQRGRPDTAQCRRVFVRIRAPHGPMTTAAVSHAVSAAGRRAGLGTIRAHRLRHTAATQLLAAGAPLVEIGQLLRHRSQLTTAIYAKPADPRRQPLEGRPSGVAHAGQAMAWRCRVSALHEALADYLTLRRAMGYKLVRAGKLLAQFVDYLDEVETSTVTVEHALAWATLPAGGSINWWAHRLSVVRGFATYLSTIDPAAEIPPTDLLAWRSKRATPYLYSDDEIVALLAATDVLSTPLRAATYRTLLGLLAVTGMRIGEAIRLDRADLDLEAGLLTVRSSKFGKDRQVLLHPTTTTALTGYLNRRGQVCAHSETPAVFVSTAGTRLLYCNVSWTFLKLVDHAGLRPRSPSCRPRIHDLRHSFAVNTVLDGYRSGADVQALLPLLSTYLGHVDPANTYWYLSAAPELLALAGRRLEDHLAGGR